MHLEDEDEEDELLLKPFPNGLPPDGSTDKIGLAPRWPLVPVLPTPVVNDQRWCVGTSYDVAVEYLGRSVVEFSTTGRTISMSGIGCSSITGHWKFQFTEKDVIAGAVSLPDMAIISNDANSSRLYVSAQSTGYLRVIFSDFVEMNTPSVNILDGLFHTITIDVFDSIMHISVDGGASSNTDISARPDFSLDKLLFKGADSDIVPLQICNIQQSLNGTLIDNIPCDESTGTGLRNTVSPLRPATLSDANAHALAWVPQASKQYEVWVWNGSAWIPS